MIDGEGQGLNVIANYETVSLTLHNFCVAMFASYPHLRSILPRRECTGTETRHAHVRKPSALSPWLQRCVLRGLEGHSSGLDLSV